MRRILVVFGVLSFGAIGLADGAACGYASRFKEDGLAGWQIVNSGDMMTIEAGTYEGVAAVVASGSKTKKGGTAWEIRSPAFALKGGDRVGIMVRARGTVKRFRFAHGYKGNYLSAIRWYDRDGKELQVPRQFGVEAVADAWRSSFASGVAPEGAVSARVAIGADSPNFGSNDVLAVSEVVARVFPPSDPAKAVTLRDDGVVLLGGKPFFPIGIYAVSPCAFNGNSLDTAFRDLKAAGFNMVHKTSPGTPKEYEEFLSLADRHDLKVFAMPTPGYSVDFFKKSLIPTVGHHPSILSWYLADDTASHVDPDVVLERHRICKTLDPDRLTLHADGVNFGRFSPYVHCSDVFLPEIYPCLDDKANGREVAEVVRDMKETMEAIRAEGSPVKSVWPVLQHFDGWGWKRFPTFAELRAMSWEGIVHGGKGVVWYVYHSRSGKGRGVVATPEHWQEMTTVSKEIASVQDDLLLRDAACPPEVSILSGPQKDGYGFRSVTCLLKSGESPLLMCVNAAANAVTVRIGVTGFRRAKEIFEGRAVDASRGLEDEFAPYAVHVYRLEK